MPVSYERSRPILLCIASGYYLCVFVLIRTLLGSWSLREFLRIRLQSRRLTSWIYGADPRASQIITVVSEAPVAKSRPSGENAIDNTSPACPAHSLRSCKVAASHS